MPLEAPSAACRMTVYEIDAGTAVIGAPVDSRMGPDIPADIGNIDAQTEIPIGQTYYVDSIVEVLCIFTVYSNQIPVGNPSVFCRYDSLVDGFRFFFSRLPENQKASRDGP